MPSKCLTCYPTKLGKKHLITVIDNVSFHYDLCKRPAIIVTPVEHITELPKDNKEFLGKLMSSILNFCYNWNIDEYKLVFTNTINNNNKHFKAKIFFTEKSKSKLDSMRNLHFDVIKRGTLYTPDKK